MHVIRSVVAYFMHERLAQPLFKRQMHRHYVSKGCALMIASNHAIPLSVAAHVICFDDHKTGLQIVLLVTVGMIGIGHPLGLFMLERA